MAIVVRYFSTSAAGAGDGTTWADRAVLFSAGAWSTVITAFDFTSDSLRCMVGPGTYSITAALSTFSSTAPTVAIPCILQACDSSGVAWVPPNPGWSSAQPVWDDSNMPVFATTTNISTINHAGVGAIGIKFTASGVGASPAIDSHNFLEWVYVLVSSTSNGANPTSGAPQYQHNCVMKVTGTAYVACSTSTYLLGAENCRFEGNLSASGGNRRGWSVTSGSVNILTRCTSVNHVGAYFINVSTAAGARLHMSRCTIAATGSGSAAAGVSVAGTSTNLSFVHQSMIVYCGTYGIDVTGTGRMSVSGCRFRNNSSGSTNGMGNWPTDQNNLESAGTNADEFVDAASGDFRIKSTSSLWGKGYGAGDQAVSAASGGYIIGS